MKYLIAVWLIVQTIKEIRELMKPTKGYTEEDGFEDFIL
jgi:hypothetical protein